MIFQKVQSHSKLLSNQPHTEHLNESTQLNTGSIATHVPQAKVSSSKSRTFGHFLANMYLTMIYSCRTAHVPIYLKISLWRQNKTNAKGGK